MRTHYKLTPEAVIDEELLAAYLGTDHRSTRPLRVSVKPSTPEPASAGPAAPAGELALNLAAQATHFKPGDEVNLTASASADAHLYCYLQDAARSIVRFYPNRFVQSAFVKGKSSVQLPGKMRFKVTAPQRGQKEIVACFATAADVARQLPAEVFARDFEALKVKSLEDVHAAFKGVTRGALALGVVHVESK